VISRTKRYKLITVCALLVALAGWVLIFLRWNGHINLLESLYVVLPGFGMGTIQSSTFVHLAASLDRSDMAIAGTAWFLAQSFGYLFGASFSTALINSVLRKQLNLNLAGWEGSDKVSSHCQHSTICG
jgi:sugar phosphate permease